MSNRARLLPWLAIGLLVPTLVYAQPIVMQAKSALYWVFGGQTLIVTVAEVGDTDEASQVTIEIRDAANVVKASMPPRSLTAGKPVIFSTQVPAAHQAAAPGHRHRCHSDLTRLPSADRQHGGLRSGIVDDQDASAVCRAHRPDAVLGRRRRRQLRRRLAPDVPDFWR